PGIAANPAPRSVAAAPAAAAAGQAAAPDQPPAAVHDARTAPTLDQLRRESARLEALVALVRPSGMHSGPALLLSADVDDRLQLIDAALSRPALDDNERVELWRRRVDALGELAAIEGTQRWMAAQGLPMDAVARVD
ncbi:MAG TPA: hypothetical protein VIG88_09555, partial [Lysobacter sp.]